MNADTCWKVGQMREELPRIAQDAQIQNPKPK
jgi:hypothetical protein